MTLSSCYFCGTAIEEPLSEYPVVPDAFAPSPDEQGTVVLCPSCHRKLSRVMDHVVTAVDDRQRRLDQSSASPDADRTTASADAKSSSSADSSTDAAGTASGIDVDDAPSIDEEAADDLLGTGPSNESGAAADADRSAEAGRTDDATRADDTDRTTDQDAAVEVDSPDGATDEPRADDGITVDDGMGTTAGSAGDTDEGTGGAGASAGGGAEANTGGSNSGGSDGDGPPQATYNRVVRLLQNREFPVERAEIATVATNAYEIPQEDFDAVIATAVDRGVLVEDGQYLKQPE